MRLFFGLQPALATRRAVAAALQPLVAHAGASISWVPLTNLHLTLAFLGEVSDCRLEAVQTAAERAVVGISPFQLAWQATPGVFGGWQQPRVIWLGVRPEVSLDRLQRSLWQQLQPLGFPEEQRWHPHLTLGRVKQRLSPAQLASVRQLSCPLPAEQFAQMVLFSSRLQPAGPVYSTVASFAFPSL